MNWDGIFVAKHPDVYEPSDDTFLLARVVGEAVRPGDQFLEVGCGAGLVSLVAARAGAYVTCTDRNPHAVVLTQQNARENGLSVDCRETDLLAGIDAAFDVVAFNPPYLPTADEDHVSGPLDMAFDGGRDGNEVVLRFAAQLRRLRPLPRVVLVVHSSLSDPGPLSEAMTATGYSMDVAALQRHAFEELTVRRFVA